LAGRDYSALLAELADELAGRSPRSAALNRAAKANLVDGGSHTIRLMEPFAPRIVAARGGRVTDEDGHDILDLWQGHLANILGHNPEVVTSELARAFGDGFGLQSGMVDRLQGEVAEILCRRTGAEQVRLTTSGTLANMYAVILSCAFTGRERVMKVGGGWHGGHPWGLKGSFFDGSGGAGFQGVDSDGIPAALTDEVIVTGFNDPDRLRDDFKRHGDRMAPCWYSTRLSTASVSTPAGSARSMASNPTSRSTARRSAAVCRWRPSPVAPTSWLRRAETSGAVCSSPAALTAPTLRLCLQRRLS